jgi:hypothetical protein
MAYLQAGFTDSKLRTLYYKDSAEGKDDAFFRSRYGAPLHAATQRKYGLADVTQGDDPMPYEFLSEQLSMRSYDDFGEPHFVDEEGRQYYGLGSKQPRVCYCRITKTITAEENSRGVVGVFRTDFPNSGDQLVLTPGKGFAKAIRPSVSHIELVVLKRIAQKTAVCQLEVSEDIPVPDGLDIDEAIDDAAEGDPERDERYRKRIEAAKRATDAAARKAEKMEKKLREQGYSFPDAVSTIAPRQPSATTARAHHAKGTKDVLGVRTAVNKEARTQVARSIKCKRVKMI